MIKRGTKNCILVELEKLSEDEYMLGCGVKLFIPNYTAKQEGSLQLDLNAHNQRIYGTCVAVPETLTKGDMVKFDDPEDLRYTDSIVPEVKIGDRVYFTYLSVNKGSLVEYEGKSYCNVNYSAILCVVRNNEIIPIGGNILCEEYFETTNSKIILTSKVSQKHAIVKIVGTPLKGDEMEVMPEDLVAFPNKFGFKNNIEGTEYLFLKYWDVQGILEQNKI